MVSDIDYVKITIDSIPPKSLTSVTRYFSRLSKAPEGNVRKLLEKLPATIAKKIDSRRAEKIVLELSKIGVKTRIERVTNQNISRPKQITPPIAKKSAQASLSQKIPEAENNKTNWKFARIGILLIIASALGWYALTTKPPGRPSTQQQKSAQAKSAITHDWYRVEWNISGAYEDSVWNRRGLAPDRRLISGLREAVFLCSRLFGDDDNGPTIQVTAKQKSFSEHSVTFFVTSKDKKKEYSIPMNVTPDGMESNINSLAEMFKSIIIDFGWRETLKTYGSKSAPGDLSFDYGSFDLGEMLVTLGSIGERFDNGEINSESISLASEMFSWLSFFTSSPKHFEISNLTATNAVATWLIADQMKAQVDVNSNFKKGLLSFGLGYPIAAKNIFTKTSASDHKLSKLLVAYIDMDLSTLKNKIDHSSNYQLPLYLLARAEDKYHSTTTNQHLGKLVNDFPSFAYGLDLAMSRGDLGRVKMADRHYHTALSQDLLEGMESLVDLKWIEGDKPFSEEVKRAISGNATYEKWIPLLADMANKSAKVKHKKGLLSIKFIKVFVNHTLLTTAERRFNLYERKLGMKAESAKIMKLTTTTFPNHETVQSLELETLIENKADYREIENKANRLDTNMAGTRLLFSLLKAKSGSTFNPAGASSGYSIISRLRLKLPPNIYGIEAMAEAFGKMSGSSEEYKYHQLHYMHDKYDPAVISNLALISNDETWYEKGESDLKDVAEYWSHRAWWYNIQDRIDDSRKSYEKAMKLDPANEAPYRLLSEMLKKRERCKDAIKIAERGFDSTPSGLSYFRLKETAGLCYAKLGNIEKAKEYLAEASRSGAGWAGLSLALFLEEQGELVQAESLIKSMVKRYPSYKYPAELAAFYLRRGARDTAIETINAYKRYNSATYYYESISKFFSERNDIEGLLTFIAEVDGKPLDKVTAFALTQKLSRQKYYRYAADISLQFAPQMPEGIHHARNALYNLTEGKLETPEHSINQIYEKIKDPRALENFAILLLTDGKFDVAFGVFEKVFDMRERRRDVELTMMASAFLSGEGGPQRMESITQRRKAAKLNAWQEKLIDLAVGKATIASVIKEAGGDRNKLCEAYFFAGLVAKRNGNVADAERYFMSAVDTGVTNYLEYSLAFSALSMVHK